MLRQWQCLLIVSLLVIAGACGGGSTPSTPTPSPTPQTFTGSLPQGGNRLSFNQTVTAPRAGTARFVLNWSNGSTNFDLYVTGPHERDTGACSWPYLATCRILGSSEANSGTSETVLIPVTANQEMQFWVNYLGPLGVASQSYTMTVTFN